MTRPHVVDGAVGVKTGPCRTGMRCSVSFLATGSWAARSGDARPCSQGLRLVHFSA